MKDSELDDVFVSEEEIADLSKASRWLAVAKLNTCKFFSQNSFKDTMRYAWNLAHEPEIKELDDNLFVLQCFCLGDWNNIML